jgi:hypothetical protein
MRWLRECVAEMVVVRGKDSALILRSLNHGKLRSITSNDLISFSQLLSHPKKYTNSGLRSDFKVNTGSSRNTSSRYETELTEDNARLRIGGLNDDDAYATRPNYKALQPGPPAAVQYPAKIKRDPTRKNEVRHSFT